MPLSEFLCRLAKGKHEPSSHERNSNYSTDLSFVPENDFVELVWENGQVQSSRARKVQACNSLPSQTPKFGEKDVNNGFSRRMGKFEVMNSVLNEAPLSVPSVDMGSNHDDDMVPWLSPIESLQHDYCSEFLPELSRTNLNEHSSQSNFSSSFDKTSGANLSMRSSNTVSAHNGFGLEQENVPRVSSANNAEAIKPRSGATRLYPSSSSEQCQTSFSVSRSRVSASNVDSISNSTYRAVSGDAIEGSTSGGVLPRTTANPSLINFSHFQRPGALVRANLQSIGLKAGSGISGIERMQSKNKGSLANSTNACDSTLNDLCGGLEKETKSSSCHPMIKSSKTDATSMEAKSVELSSPKEMPEPMAQEDGSKSNRNFQHDIDENATPGPENVERPLEPIVASSSVCSGNSVERASDDPAQNRKRKHQDTEESEDPSDGAEEESVGAKKRAPPQGGSSCKRSRAAEVHNLSERRRRDRINEKMRALQELIPNCNKVDKASMLDEAIEYLKTLQLQVQIMSMGAGLYMPSMMLPPGMSHMHAGHMAQFLPMGVGMGFGMGMPDMNGGSSGRSMYQVPPMHRANYSSQPVSGMAPNLMMFGMPGQGLPIPFACPSMMPMSEGSHGRPNMEVNPCAAGGPMDNINSAVASSSKDSIENMNLQVMQSKVAASSMNQTSNQCQATNELHQSAVVENDGLTAQATKNGALNSVDRNEPS